MRRPRSSGSWWTSRPPPAHRALPTAHDRTSTRTLRKPVTARFRLTRLAVPVAETRCRAGFPDSRCRSGSATGKASSKSMLKRPPRIRRPVGRRPGPHSHRAEQSRGGEPKRPRQLRCGRDYAGASGFVGVSRRRRDPENRMRLWTCTATSSVSDWRAMWNSGTQVDRAVMVNASLLIRARPTVGRAMTRDRHAGVR